jgi:hypothetical protein
MTLLPSFRPRDCSAPPLSLFLLLTVHHPFFVATGEPISCQLLNYLLLQISQSWPTPKLISWPSTRSVFSRYVFSLSSLFTRSVGVAAVPVSTLYRRNAVRQSYTGTRLEIAIFFPGVYGDGVVDERAFDSCIQHNSCGVIAQKPSL